MTHRGQPEVFDFDFELMDPAAEPTCSGSGGSSSGSRLGGARLVGGGGGSRGDGYSDSRGVV